METTDRTDIACIIAEWWSLQKKKKRNNGSPFHLIDLVDTTITIETILKVDNVDPLQVSEDYSQIVVKGNTQGGPKIVQKFQSKMNNDFLRNKTVGVSKKPIEIKQFNIKHCGFCRYEIKYKSGEESEIFNRDCGNLCNEAQEYFLKNSMINFSKAEIAPVENCPFWKKAKAEKITPRKDQESY